MAYDELLAGRVQETVDARSPVPAQEKKMFGGLAFMIQGNMCVGVNGDNLMVRVGPDQYEEALSEPHARPMDFTGRPIRGFVYVDPAGCATTEDLAAWIERGLTFALSLPAK